MVQRFDISELGKVRRDSVSGRLTAPAFLSRVGVFTYVNPDGTERREFRSPAEVFHADSLASYSLAPMTLRHPPSMLTAATAKEFMVGSVGEDVRADGDRIAANVSIVDAAAIAAVDAGTVDLSCGYLCDVEEESGEWNGEKYDAVQKNIRGNHVAIVERGRAGPTVGIRLDAADAYQKEGAARPEPKAAPMSKTRTVRLDGIDFADVPETAAQAFDKVAAELDKVRADAAAVSAENDANKAKLDAALESLEAEKTARADAASPEAVAKLVAARVSLETVAAKILGESNFDGVDNEDLRKRVILKVSPNAKLDAASADYIAARFDAAVDSAADGAVDKLRADVDNASGDRTDSADSARAEMLKRNASLALPAA